MKTSSQESCNSEPNGFTLIEIEGDLFTSSDSLCHCVSEDLRMGKGIAKVFRTKFGSINELKGQGAQTGQMAVLKDRDRFIYYLVTKPYYYSKPTYQTLESSLKMMKDHMVSNNVTRLSMPLIGCGLDRLKWEEVRKLLKQVFNRTNITITVYTLPEKEQNL